MGRKLIRDLAEGGAQVRAFVKNQAQAELTEADGATEAFIGDIRNPGDVARSLKGIRQVFHAAPTSVIHELPIAEAIVTASRANGVEHIVFHSVIHPEIAELFHHQEKGRVEQLLQASGVPTTSLRSSHFMQNYLDFWEFLLAGTLPYPTSPDRLMGVVDVEDVSEVGARVLTSPDAHLGKTYDLSTVEITRRQMAEIWGEVLGHPVTAVRIPPSSVVNPLRAAGSMGAVVQQSVRATHAHGLPHLVRAVRESSNVRGVRGWTPEAKQCYVEMMQYYDKNGLPAGDMTVLPTLLGRPATTYMEFARREAVRRGAVVPAATLVP